MLAACPQRCRQQVQQRRQQQEEQERPWVKRLRRGLPALLADRRGGS